MRRLYEMSRSAVAMLAIVSISSTSAFAALPGEGDKFEKSVYDIGRFTRGTQIDTDQIYNEARLGDGTLLTVWVGSDHRVYGAINNNLDRFPIGETQTDYAPTVTTIGDQFMVLHTGVDNNVYYTFLQPNSLINPTWGAWIPIPGVTTENPVNAVQYAFNNVFMTYTDTDQRIRGTWFGTGTVGWAPPQFIGNGGSLSAPNVAFNPTTNSLWIVARGFDDAIWITQQTAGIPGWSPWDRLGQTVRTSPSIAAAQDGNMVISYVDENEFIFYRRFDRRLNSFDSNWVMDRTHWQTFNPTALIAVASIIYVLITGQDNGAYWKQVTQL